MNDEEQKQKQPPADPGICIRQVHPLFALLALLATSGSSTDPAYLHLRPSGDLRPTSRLSSTRLPSSICPSQA